MKFQRSFVTALFLALIAITRTAAAQSTDQGLPTPVLSNEINGRVAALDLGDPRLTRHFYAFEGVPGDLLVTLSSQNLNGDIDIFTATTFRPIIKITMYAGGVTVSPEVTKGFYLRARQVLILRVEARTPNDDWGTYKVRFGGAYEPFSGGIPVAEESTESNEVARTSGGNTRRLSSVGARIEAPSSEPTPKPAEETASNPPTSAKVTKPKAPRNGPTRTARGRASRPTRSKPASTVSETKTEPAKTEAAKIETAEEKKEPAPKEEKPAAAAEEKPSTPEKPAAQEAVVPQPGARLIIEEKDGTKIDRPMSTVRRVVIEGGTIVIVLKTGRIERVPMSLVAKMSIEP
ncbi:MAG TPA: hypothetical protein VHE60_16285 [Pyrinomonadaceae bacterium]|nr:hypothetical protein [Pyrinomonadaceae bacterium]